MKFRRHTKSEKIKFKAWIYHVAGQRRSDPSYHNVSIPLYLCQPLLVEMITYTEISTLIGEQRALKMST